MSDRLGRAVLELSTEGQGAIINALDQVATRAERTGDKFEKAAGNVQVLGTAFKAFLAADITRHIVNGLGAIVDAVDEFDTLAGRIDSTVEGVQKLKALATTFDTELGAIVSGIQTMEAKLGAGTLDEPLRAINIEVAEFRKLDPTERYLRVAEALGGIEDSATRAALAKQFFSAAAKELATTLRTDVREGMSGVITITNETAEAVDLLSRAWDKSKQSAVAFGASLLSLVSGLEAYVRLKEYFGTPVLPDVGPANILNSPAAAKKLSEFDFAQIEKELTRTAQEKIAANKKATDDEKRELERRKANLRDFYNWLEERRFEDRKNEVESFDRSKAAWASYVAYLKSTKLQLLGTPVDIAATMEPLKPAVRSAMPNRSEWTETWSEMKVGLSDTLAGLPQLFSQAFTGGGGIMGAFKALGVQLAGAIAKPIFEEISKAIAKALAAKYTANIVAGGASSGASGAASGAAGAAGANAGIGAGTTAAIGIGAVVGVGLIAWGIMRHQSKVREERLKLRHELQLLEQDLTKHREVMEAIGLDTKSWWKPGGKAEDIQGNIERLSGLFAEFQKRIEGVNNQFAPLLQQAEQLGLRLPQAILDSLGSLSQLGILTGAQADAVKRLTDASTVDWKKMEDAAGRYGDWLKGELGPAFKQLKFSDAAKQIINDFDLLDRGGASVGSILAGMTSKINEMVLEAKRGGLELPENMKPWIQHLIDEGKLIDENGNKMTDMAGLKFGAPIKTEFELITDALKDLIKMLGDLAAAIRNLPTPTIPVPAPVPGTGGGGSGTTPGQGPSDPGEGFATGTYGRYGRFFHNFGRRMQTALHGVEAVIRPDQALAFAESVIGSGGDGSDKPLLIQVDRDVLARAVIRRQGNQLSLLGAR